MNRDVCNSLPQLASELRELSVPLTYTAFDGDHFDFIPFMRSYGLARSIAPANPESILGYKDAVCTYGQKSGVLLADLAILRRCAALWVFTDARPDPRSVTRNLAEGVIVELLFYLWASKDGQRPPPEFVPKNSLFGAGKPRKLYNFNYEDTLAELGPDQQGIVRFFEELDKGIHSLPSIIYFARDPLDGKYVHWLRAGAYAQPNRIPLVPSLAIEFQDAAGISLPVRTRGLGRLAYVTAMWTRLMDLADELWILPPMELGRYESYTTELLAQVWLTYGGSRQPAQRRTWKEFEIPKATMGAHWSLTEKDGSL